MVFCIFAVNAKAGPPPDRKLEGTIDVIGGSNSLSKLFAFLASEILSHFSSLFYSCWVLLCIFLLSLKIVIPCSV